MSIKLTPQQKAAMPYCSCPLPTDLHHQTLSKKAVVVPMLIIGLIALAAWVLWPVGGQWLLGLYAVIIIGNLIYRLIRGHTLWCAIKWSPISALYIIGEGIASATP